MQTSLKHWAASPRLHRALSGLLRLYTSSYRINIVNEEQWQQHAAQGGRVLLCLWHQQIFGLLNFARRYRSYRPAIMISQSSDGDLVAGVAAHCGLSPVRGSTSRGGKTALRGLIRHYRSHDMAGHVMDGPRGPSGRVKSGAIRLALAVGAVIVPLYVSADRAWYFNSWDRFFVPKPFATVTIRFDDIIHLPKCRSDSEFEAQRLRVEAAMRPALIIPD